MRPMFEPSALVPSAPRLECFRKYATDREKEVQTFWKFSQKFQKKSKKIIVGTLLSRSLSLASSPSPGNTRGLNPMNPRRPRGRSTKPQSNKSFPRQAASFTPNLTDMPQDTTNNIISIQFIQLRSIIFNSLILCCLKFNPLEMLGEKICHNHKHY